MTDVKSVMPELKPDIRPSKYFKCSTKPNAKGLEPIVIMKASCGYKYSADKKTAYIDAKSWENVNVPSEFTEITEAEFKAV